MGVTARWVRKLLKRIANQGGAVVHGLRGRPSNRKLSAKTQRQALAVLKQADWRDFGPASAVEQLAKQSPIQVGKEILRGWMMEAGLWKSTSQPLPAVRPWRPRQSAFGELRHGALWNTIGWKEEARCLIWCA